MRTPEEIKKGLECCNAFNACPSCPYEHIVDTEHGWGCVVIRNADALAYTQQLERERDEARNDLDAINYANTELHSAYEAMKRERDAAVEILHDFKMCAGCNHKGCADCRWFDDMTMKNRDLRDNWQWHGVQKGVE